MFSLSWFFFVYLEMGVIAETPALMGLWIFVYSEMGICNFLLLGVASKWVFASSSFCWIFRNGYLSVSFSH